MDRDGDDDALVKGPRIFGVFRVLPYTDAPKKNPRVPTTLSEGKH